MKNEVVTQKQQEQGMQWLDVAYGQAIKGIGLGDTSVEKMAGDYLAKYSSAEEACKAMLKNVHPVELSQVLGVLQHFHLLFRSMSPVCCICK